eukprot:7187873-Prymnesium_polylepis.2
MGSPRSWPPYLSSQPHRRVGGPCGRGWPERRRCEMKREGGFERNDRSRQTQQIMDRAGGG